MKTAFYGALFVTLLIGHCAAAGIPASAPTPVPKGRWVLIAPPILVSDKDATFDFMAPLERWMVIDGSPRSRRECEYKQQRGKELAAKQFLVDASDANEKLWLWSGEIRCVLSDGSSRFIEGNRFVKVP